jgi:hypothetical protein
LNYRAEFKDRVGAIQQAIDDMPGNLDALVPGLTPAKLKRFFQRFDVLLGRLDKQGAKHPQFLYYGGGPLPAHLNTLVDQSIAHMPSGAATFVTNNFTQLTDMQDRLERAVGTDVDELKRIASTTSTDLHESVRISDDLLDKIREISASADASFKAMKAQSGELLEVVAEAKKGNAEIQQRRSAASQAVNPAGKMSLDTLGRKAREKFDEINGVKSKIDDMYAESSANYEGLNLLIQGLENRSKKVDSLREEAESVLQLSSQAGLAASYRQEAIRLSKMSAVFTGVLYVSAIATLVIAAFYVLPELNEALKGATEGVTFVEALGMTFLRALVLGPLIYVLFFTTKRISSIEMLRMDYAEKAAASLSYSGYKDEMAVDADLLRQLKASLISKFQDHPERLLRLNATTTIAKVQAAGFSAETRVEASPNAGGSLQNSEDKVAC